MYFEKKKDNYLAVRIFSVEFERYKQWTLNVSDLKI